MKFDGADARSWHAGRRRKPSVVIVVRLIFLLVRFQWAISQGSLPRLHEGHVGLDRPERRPLLERVLFVLTRVLPAAEREQTFMEWCGNLDYCETRWERIRFVAELAIGIPRLAYVMHQYPRALHGASRYGRARQ
jgi:hypothetical protein